MDGWADEWAGGRVNLELSSLMRRSAHTSEVMKSGYLRYSCNRQTAAFFFTMLGDVLHVCRITVSRVNYTSGKGVTLLLTLRGAAS